MKTHYNIILANAPIRNGNRGCVALSITTMYIIDRIMRDNNKTYSLFLTDSQHNDYKEHTYRILGKDIHYTEIPYPKTYNFKQDLSLCIKQILKRTDYSNPFRIADYILDIGQGDSFADIYGKNRFSTIDRIHKLAREYEKEYCILPQTIGPFIDQGIKSEANESIASATLCMARDKQSYDYVAVNVPSQASINEYIDVAFFMPYQKIEQDKNFIHVGLNISALLWNGGYTNNNQFGLKDDYKELIKSIIDYFLCQPNVIIHLVPHVVSQERNIENDYEVSYELWHDYNNPNLQLAPFALGPIEIKSYIAGLDFFMGARMHATIGAFSSGVPVVPMAYSRKFNGLFEDTLDYHYMTDMKDQTKDEILSVIRDSFNKRSELKAIIDDRMSTIVKEREQLMYNDLSKFFNIAK